MASSVVLRSSLCMFSIKEISSLSKSDGKIIDGIIFSFAICEALHLLSPATILYSSTPCFLIIMGCINPCFLIDNASSLIFSSLKIFLGCSGSLIIFSIGIKNKFFSLGLISN